MIHNNYHKAPVKVPRHIHNYDTQYHKPTSIRFLAKYTRYTVSQTYVHTLLRHIHIYGDTQYRKPTFTKVRSGGYKKTTYNASL